MIYLFLVGAFVFGFILGAFIHATAFESLLRDDKYYITRYKLQGKTHYKVSKMELKDWKENGGT